MTLALTRWQMDTCECIVLLASDVDQPENVRTFTFVQHLNNCSQHPNLTGVDRYNIASEENKRVGDVLKIALNNNVGGVAETTILGTKQLKQGIDYTWSYSGLDAKRVLMVSLGGLSAIDKTQLQTLLDQQLQVGKVVVL